MGLAAPVAPLAHARAAKRQKNGYRWSLAVKGAAGARYRHGEVWCRTRWCLVRLCRALTCLPLNPTGRRMSQLAVTAQGRQRDRRVVSLTPPSTKLRQGGAALQAKSVRQRCARHPGKCRSGRQVTSPPGASLFLEVRLAVVTLIGIHGRCRCP